MHIVKRYPVVSYYVVAFAISWGGVLVAIGGPSALIWPDEETSGRFTAGLFATLAGPALAGLMLTWAVAGREGFRWLGARLSRWRVGLRWCAVVLATAPLSVTVTLIVLAKFSGDFTPGYLASADSARASEGTLSMSAPVALIAGVITGFLEELGWTGFAMPRLLPRYGVATTGVIMGLLWGLWHLLSNLWGSGEDSESVPLVLYMTLLLFTFLPPYRMLMVWMYAHTESLLLTMLMHASLVTFWLISAPEGIAGAQLVTWYAAWGVVLWGLVGAVALTQRRRASPRSIAGSPPSSPAGAPAVIAATDGACPDASLAPPGSAA